MFVTVPAPKTIAAARGAGSQRRAMTAKHQVATTALSTAVIVMPSTTARGG